MREGYFVLRTRGCILLRPTSSVVLNKYSIDEIKSNYYQNVYLSLTKVREKLSTIFCDFRGNKNESVLNFAMFSIL